MTTPGILVVTGASGSGKTATVRALEARALSGVRCYYTDRVEVVAANTGEGAGFKSSHCRGLPAAGCSGHNKNARRRHAIADRTPPLPNAARERPAGDARLARTRARRPALRACQKARALGVTRHPRPEQNA